MTRPFRSAMDCVSATAVRFCTSGSGTRSNVQRWQQFAEPLFSQSEVVKIPRIVDETEAPELPRRASERDDAPTGSGSPHVTTNEWRFSVDLREVLEAHRSIFSVIAEDEILFKARVCPGGVLAITAADSYRSRYPCTSWLRAKENVNYHGWNWHLCGQNGNIRQSWPDSVPYAEAVCYNYRGSQKFKPTRLPSLS